MPGVKLIVSIPRRISRSIYCEEFFGIINITLKHKLWQFCDCGALWAFVIEIGISAKITSRQSS